MNSFTKLQTQIESLFEQRELLQKSEFRQAVLESIELLDQGQIRVAEKKDGSWVTHAWVKKAILLYFGVMEVSSFDCGPFQYADKIPLKAKGRLGQIRVVPGGILRKGCFVAPKCVVMPGFVNIGAFVDEETMIDTWATVGSCAQIGKRVHLSGGVGIGGVLEPPQADPVILEDNVFVGSRAIVVEGVRVDEGAVLAANVVLTASTKIIDVSGSHEKEYRGHVPARSVVIPGMRMKKFPAGEFGVPVALIIGQRKKSTDEKTSLNDALRDFEVPV